MTLFVGLDIGTSRTKALVINSRGKLVASSSLDSYNTEFSRPGWAEQDPDDWWKAVKEVLLAVIEKNEVDPEEISGIGLTGQMHGPVFLDSEGHPLCPCMIWSDTRAKEESNRISQLVPEVTEITGNPVSSGFTAPKILWMRENNPGLFDRVRKIVLPKDFIGYKLTGDIFTDPSDASGSLLFDIREGEWNEQILSRLDINRDRLPSIENSTSIAGGLRPEVASEFGLSEEVPVIVGAGDLATSLIGNGAVRRGSASVTVGTAGQVLAPAGELRENFLTSLYSFRSPDFEGFFTLGTVPSGGLSLQWFRDSVSKVESLIEKETRTIDSFDLLSKQAATAPAGARGLIFLPYLMGTGNPHLDYTAKGGFIGLTPDHGKSEMIRSIMEGVTMALKESLEVTEQGGAKIESVRLGAGATNSQVWNQIQADIYGREVQLVNVKDPSPFGAALLAGVGLDVFSSIEAATDSAVSITSRIEPDQDRSRRYDELAKIYRETYRSLEKIFPKMEQFGNLETS